MVDYIDTFSASSVKDMHVPIVSSTKKDIVIFSEAHLPRETAFRGLCFESSKVIAGIEAMHIKPVRDVV